MAQHESTLFNLITSFEAQALQALNREYEVAERRARALDAIYVSSPACRHHELEEEGINLLRPCDAMALEGWSGTTVERDGCLGRTDESRALRLLISFWDGEARD